MTITRRYETPDYKMEVSSGNVPMTNNHDERHALEAFGLWCILAGVGLGIGLSIVLWRVWT